MYHESKTEDGITDEECSDMEIEYILLPKLKGERSVEPISRDSKYLCAACLDQQCRSIKCIRCKPVMAMMTGLTLFDANCRIDYTSGRTTTTGRKRSLGTYLRIDLVEIIKYSSAGKTIHLGYTLTKWIRAH